MSMEMQYKTFNLKYIMITIDYSKNIINKKLFLKIILFIKK